MIVLKAKTGGGGTRGNKLSKINLVKSIETEQEVCMNLDMKYWSLSRAVLMISEWSWRR